MLTHTKFLPTCPVYRILLDRYEDKTNSYRYYAGLDRNDWLAWDACSNRSC